MRILVLVVPCVFGLLLMGMACENRVDQPESSISPGQKLYEQYCLACHQGDGKGVPGLNPPLTGTDWVSGNKARLIKVVLQGLDQPLTINGEEYQNPMPSHAFLSDQEIADVLTFIRSNFGNKASEVKASEVAKVRSSK